MKNRRIIAKQKYTNYKGFGKPFFNASDRSNKPKNLFRVDFIHYHKDIDEETYYNSMWYEIRDIVGKERAKLLQAIENYKSKDGIKESPEMTLLFINIAIELDDFRKANYKKENLLLPNTAFIFPAVQKKDEIIRTPIAQYVDNGEYYINLKKDHVLRIICNKSVFTSDKLQLLE